MESPKIVKYVIYTDDLDDLCRIHKSRKIKPDEQLKFLVENRFFSFSKKPKSGKSGNRLAVSLLNMSNTLKSHTTLAKLNENVKGDWLNVFFDQQGFKDLELSTVRDVMLFMHKNNMFDFQTRPDNFHTKSWK